MLLTMKDQQGCVAKNEVNEEARELIQSYAATPNRLIYASG
jgi:hypothetical protein